MSLHLKELHLGSQIKDLDKHLNLPDIKGKKLGMLVDRCRNIYDEGERHYQLGDQEMAYIYYMRYFKLLVGIRKKPEYAQHKKMVQQTLGGDKVNQNIMNKVEILKESLITRYNSLNESKSLTKSVASKLPMDKPDTNSNLSATKTRADANSHPNKITCRELFEKIQKNSVLIMDCRPHDDYAISHLTYEWSFNVPEQYISKGMSAGKLQDKLDSNAKRLWSARSVKDQVVIIDWTSINLSANDATSSILLDMLQNWDPDTTYRSPVKILHGGYEYFIILYPTLSTNPTVQAPKSPKEDEDMIEDIEYPSIHDITMKDEIRDGDFTYGPLSQNTLRNNETSSTIVQRPVIDRSSKIGAMKTYEEKAIAQIVKEHEELLQKDQVNEDQHYQTMQKLEKLYEEKVDEDRFKDDGRMTEEQELLFNLMQMDNAVEDDKTKTDFLLAKLKKIKDRIYQDQEEISPNLEEVIRKIGLKLHERQQLNQKRELERKQKKKHLAVAREYKNNLRNSVSEDEDNIKPRHPHFDRSIKPTINTTITRITDRPRDFSPVSGNTGPGITGLKNLGNTCYMNSILQCLSNTPQLATFCIKDEYEICRNNKTQGHIIEEFAALLKMLWCGKFRCVASKDLHQIIGKYHKIFSGYEQQDSHEFLTILMDWLHSDLQTLRVQEKMSESLTASEKAWSDFTKTKESLILCLFYGQIKSTVKCKECQKESATYESFSNLSLELPTTNSYCNLYQCMAMYFSGEEIHGWNCPSCNEKRYAIKKLDISKRPPVLVIHLKRFYADPEYGNNYKKQQNYVEFPLENLDISSCVAKSESRSMPPKSYDLYAVSNHYGSMESGHYTAFCKNGNYNRWYKYDDQLVTPLESSNVVSSAAYILFYTYLPSMQISTNC